MSQKSNFSRDTIEKAIDATLVHAKLLSLENIGEIPLTKVQ